MLLSEGSISICAAPLLCSCCANACLADLLPCLYSLPSHGSLVLMSSLQRRTAPPAMTA